MASSAVERAVAHVAERASTRSDTAKATIARILARHGYPESRGHALVATLAEHARVTLNFHPDRLRVDGVTVVEGLFHDGRYRSQFDTGVTNGSPTAFPGGARDTWEESLFGGAYHAGNASVEGERPKYGAFNVMAHSDGASPRFGSCYFELSKDVLPRCTFTWGDSHQGPEHIGTISEFDAVLAAWLDAVDTTGTALGVSNLDVPTLFAMFSTIAELRASTIRAPGRALDAYIEAQVHGTIDLAKDVEALVVDPAFDDTDVGRQLVEVASRHGFQLRKHAGFVLHPSEVPSDFRGPRMRPLAERISGGREFDAATLGRAAESLVREPATWNDWGAPEETWQHIKQLWHVLVAFGRAR